jgi:cell division protein ZapA
MGKVSLKVTIAGRTYPLNIKESEKDGVIAAVSDINRSIENLKNNYAVKDPQDLIAMTALQLVMKSDSNAKSVSTDKSSNSMDFIEKALADLSDKLDLE